jgi:Leucine-rich repeat (LRR) protein
MKQLVITATVCAAFFVLPIAAQTNVALNKAVTVSSVQSGNPAANAVDGSTTTRWCASAGTVPQWLRVDLGASYSISRTEVMWEKTAVYKYKVETSADNSTWTQRVDRTANTLSQQTFVDNFTITARYVRITATSLPSGVWASIFEFRVFGTNPSTPPVISTQPVNRTVTEGQSATFTIAATGNPTPTYQWRRNGTTISGATSTSYTITTTAMTDSGAVFSCVVSNAAGSVTSNNAVLTVQRDLRRQDSLALVGLYNGIGGPNWTNKDNWLTSQPIDTWYGVTLTSGRVTQLNLDNDNLNGSIPLEVGNLTGLQILNLNYNNLTGTIPDTIRNLTRLIHFNLSSNSLIGTIPAWIGNITNLYSLSIIHNQLTGSIPSSLGRLTNLYALQLSENQLSGGIPPDIGNLTNLGYLMLSSNQLTGQIPVEMCGLSHLEQLHLSGNQLTGQIPHEIGNLRNLIEVDLSLNNFTGEIPSEISNLTQMLDLNLAATNLSGAVPPQFSALIQLVNLSLERNLFTSLPETIVNLTSISACKLGYNQLCDLSPAVTAWANRYDPDWASTQICTPPERIQDSLSLVALYNSTGGPNWTNKTNWLTSQPIDMWFGVTLTSRRVTQLYLYGNNLSGLIPPEIGNLTNLENFDFGNNRLSGVIPDTIRNLSRLITITLSGNTLQGTIPDWIGNLRDLQYLYVNNNQLSGSIPSSLGRLTNLYALQLVDNQLSGNIPIEIGTMSSLVSLYLSGNQLTGQIPHEIGNLRNLQVIEFSLNSLTGQIPEELGNLIHLTNLSLVGNNLSGAIPSHFGALTQLQALFLNANSFTALPDSITNLTNIVVCNLGWNQFCNLSPTVAAWADTHDPDWASTQSCAKPEVQIIASPTGGIPPLTVSFTATNIGPTMIDTWSWTFGDGGTAAIQNPSYIYTTGGTYTARLIAKGIGNSGFDTASITIEVDIPPSIITQPVSQTVYQGSTATFSVAAAGTAPLSYQWQKNGVLIPGATSSNYSKTNVQPEDSGDYTVVVSNVAGSVTSAAAHLTVTPPPQPPLITRDPESQTVTVSGSALFSVTATGEGPLSYSWRKNGIVVGGNTSTYGVSQVSFNDSGSYKVIVTNALGSDTSAVATLTVIPVANRSTSQQVSLRGMLYDSAGVPVGQSGADTIEATVRLYDSLNAGTVHYTEFFRKADQHAIEVKKGVFTILLGKGTTADTLWRALERDSSLWVEITVEGTPPDVLLPRLPLTAALYVLNNSQNSATLRTVRMAKGGLNAPQP